MSLLDQRPGAGEPSSGARTTAPDGFDDLSRTFEPVTARLRYDAPQSSIDADATKGWIARMWPVLRTHTGLFALALVAGLVSMVVKVLVPRYVGYAVDEALLPPVGQREPLARYVEVLGVLAVVGMATGYLTRYLLFRTAYAIEFDLRVLMYRHLSRLSFPFYDRVQSGQLISRANSDIRSVQMFLAFGPFFLAQFAMFAVAITFMAQIHVGLTLLAVVTLPFVFVVGVRMRGTMFPISWLVQARMADIATLVDENINGVRVVKSFAGEQRQVEAVAAASVRLRWVSLQLIRVRARYGPLMENLTRFGEALILLYGGFLVIDGDIRAGDILVFLSYLALLQAPFRMLGFVMMMQQRAAASAGRIYEVLDEQPTIADAPGAVDLLDCRGEVELRDVTFAYGDDGPEVFTHLDLHVPAGQVVAIVGRTGSGKTTLAELLPRFYDVRAGAVLIDGHDVRDLTLTSLRAAIGICFDEPFLFSASLHDNIAYGRPDATRAEVEAAARAAGAHGFISGLDHGYDTVVGERGYTLSGGQRQRVAIARTILEDPAILILDDATSAIDVQVELAIHENLRRLVTGRTTLIIAHRLSTISLAERVVLLEGGRVVASGTHAQLMADEPRYAAVLAHLEDDAPEVA